VPDTTASAGTSWYRTNFTLDIPHADDASLGLTIGDPAVPRSSAHYRALIFVNGWNMGQYVADTGPQHTFVIPNGVLNPDGRNTIALAVTSNGGAGDLLESVRLTDLGAVRGGVPVAMDASPRYAAPAVRVTCRAPSGTLATVSVPPDALGTALASTVDWGDGTSSPGMLAGTGDTRTVSGEHQYARPGHYPVTVRVVDAYGGAVLSSDTGRCQDPERESGI
jgi:hypothetical protein